MAIQATAVWEVRPTNGGDTQGAAYDSGLAGAGTDYSQQDSHQLSLTDLATSGAGVTTLTSVTGGFTAAMIGNAIRINSGTNFQVGYYFITARADTNTVTLDRTPSSGAAGSLGAGKVGGAAATISQQATTTLNASLVAGNKVWVKNEAWNEAVTLSVAGNSTNAVIVEGYNASRGDNPTGANRPRNNRASAAGTGINLTALGIIVKNIWVSNAGGAGFVSNTGFNYFINCRSSSNGTIGFNLNGSVLIGCEADTNTTSGFTAVTNASIHYACNYHGNTTTGLTGATVGVRNMQFCLIYANSSHGISVSTGPIVIINCTVDGNTGATTDGINASSIPGNISHVLNTILSNNGRYGGNISASSTGLVVDYNNFFGNATAARNNFPTGTNDTALDPQYVNSAGGDYGIGTNLKALGYPGLFPAGLLTGYIDIGAVQRQEKAVHKLVGAGGLAG